MIERYDKAVADGTLEALDTELKGRRWKAPSLHVDIF